MGHFLIEEIRVVLGVKNRAELRECVSAEGNGPLIPELVARIDAVIGRPQ